MKRRGLQSLISRAKVIHQDYKDFNKETENIRHDLMLNEYLQEFVDCMKPPKSNCPLSDTTHQGTVIVPYVKGISENFRHNVSHFNVRTIFKTKHTWWDTDENWTG
jgi:hypothetical protein